MHLDLPPPGIPTTTHRCIFDCEGATVLSPMDLVGEQPARLCRGCVQGYLGLARGHLEGAADGNEAEGLTPDEIAAFGLELLWYTQTLAAWSGESQEDTA
jgi:hypothetical protein